MKSLQYGASRALYIMHLRSSWATMCCFHRHPATVVVVTDGVRVGLLQGGVRAPHVGQLAAAAVVGDAHGQQGLGQRAHVVVARVLVPVEAPEGVALRTRRGAVV